MPINNDIIKNLYERCKLNSWVRPEQYFNFLSDKKALIEELFESIENLDYDISKVSCALVTMDDKKIFAIRDDLEKTFKAIYVDRNASKEDLAKWKKLKLKLISKQSKKLKVTRRGEEFDWDRRFEQRQMYKDVDLYGESQNIPAVFKAIKNILAPSPRFHPPAEESETSGESMSSSNDDYLKASLELKNIYDADAILKEAQLWPFDAMGRWVGNKISDLSSYIVNIGKPKITAERAVQIKNILEQIYFAAQTLPIRSDGWPPPGTSATPAPRGWPTQESLDSLKEKLNTIVEKTEELFHKFDKFRNKGGGEANKVYDDFEKYILSLRSFLISNKNKINDYIDPTHALSGNAFDEDFGAGISLNAAAISLINIRDEISRELRGSAGLNPAADGNFSKKEKKSHKNFKNLEKTANYNLSCVPCQSKDTNNMKKKADKFSNKYYRDAVSGLDDGTAKSYFTGLKGMYGKKPKKTKADYVKLYELHDETGPDLIGSAHPQTIDIAESMGNGGVVENQIEQQRHNLGVAQSMPSGNFQGKHAWVIHNLVKLAEYADSVGDFESSDLIDEALEELRNI